MNKLPRLDLPMRHRDKQKTVFLCLLCHEKIGTNATYVQKASICKTWLGIYYKWQRHEPRNPTKRHCLKSINNIA